MKFDDEHIGGREVGPVRINVYGDKRRGAALIGVARVMLGNLKRRMQIGEIRTGQDTVKLPEQRSVSSLYDLILYGELQAGSVTTDQAAKINVAVVSDGGIAVSSILGLADMDTIDITVNTRYTLLGEKGVPTVAGFEIHFKNTAPWDANGYYWVASPYGTTGKAMLLFAVFRDDDEAYVPWDTTYSATLFYRPRNDDFMVSTQWYTVRHFGDPRRVPVTYLGADYDPWIPGSNDYQYYNSTVNGLYITGKECFNHVDPNYTFAQGYVGKAACYLYKDTVETAVMYDKVFMWDVISGLDAAGLTGNNLNVPKARKFENGWYAIGMACMAQHVSITSVSGGLTFIYKMSDGGEFKFDFDQELYSGNWRDVIDGDIQSSGPLNPGKYFIMFNPILGLIELYEDSGSDSPFLGTTTSGGFYNFGFELQKDFHAQSNKPKPIRVIDVFELIKNS